MACYVYGVAGEAPSSSPTKLTDPWSLTDHSTLLPPVPFSGCSVQEMIAAAITALKDRSGSSSVAIAKYLGANFKLPANYPK